MLNQNIVSNIVAIKAFFMWHNSICTNVLTFFDDSIHSSHKVTRTTSDIKFYYIISKFLPNFAGDVVIKISPIKDKPPSIKLTNLNTERLIPTPFKLCRGQLDPTLILKCFVKL